MYLIEDESGVFVEYSIIVRGKKYTSLISSLSILMYRFQYVDHLLPQSQT